MLLHPHHFTHLLPPITYHLTYGHITPLSPRRGAGGEAFFFNALSAAC